MCAPVFLSNKRQKSGLSHLFSFNCRMSGFANSVLSFLRISRLGQQRRHYPSTKNTDVIATHGR
jgi:hypothetical protein